MYIEKKNSLKQILGKLRGLIKPPNVMVKTVSPSIKILRDVHIPTPDGSYLSANIYRPEHKVRFPTLLSLHHTLCSSKHPHGRVASSVVKR